MTVHIEISSRQKMPYLLDILGSLDFVETVCVDDELSTSDVAPPATKRSNLVTKHNGAIPHLDVEAFENTYSPNPKRMDTRGCVTLVTNNIQDFTGIDGLTVVNPFEHS